MNHAIECTYLHALYLITVEPQCSLIDSCSAFAFLTSACDSRDDSSLMQVGLAYTVFWSVYCRLRRRKYVIVGGKRHPTRRSLPTQLAKLRVHGDTRTIQVNNLMHISLVWSVDGDTSHTTREESIRRKKYYSIRFVTDSATLYW